METEGRLQRRVSVESSFFSLLSRPRLKRLEVNRSYKLLLRRLDTRSKLTLTNKLLIYNTILKLDVELGELWGSAKPSNINRIQSLQSIILRKITNCPFYVFNSTSMSPSSETLPLKPIPDSIVNSYSIRIPWLMTHQPWTFQVISPDALKEYGLEI